jgi:SAM-dependent methyltransferase
MGKKMGSLSTTDNQPEHWEFMLSALPKNQGQNRLLDFGCGSGQLAESLLEHGGIGQVVAADISLDEVTAAHERLSRFSSDRCMVIHADAFDLDPNDFDIIIFNPPMVPNEEGFFRGSRKWCFLEFLEWFSGATSVAYVLLFDYCEKFKYDDQIVILDQEIKDFDLEYKILRSAQRIVHDDSPVWVNRDLVRRWFPTLMFQQTDFGYQNVQRTVERRIIKLS